MNNKKTKYEQERNNFHDIVNKLCCCNIPVQQINKEFNHWVTYRKLHSDFLINGCNSQFYIECAVSCDHIDITEKNIFFLFHYGPYFSLPLHFIKKFNYSGAAFILTSKSIDFELVHQCAKSFKIDLEPIIIDKSGFFVKKVLKARKENKCIFILVDLPVGSDDKNYKMFETNFGKIKHRLGYMRIASILKQKPSLIVPKVDDCYKKMYIRHMEINSHDDIVNTYLSLLRCDYKNFERINELEKMCEFK